METKNKVNSARYLLCVFANCALALLVMFLTVVSVAQASVPGLISYQGVLNDDAGQPVDGNIAMIFSMYDVPTGGVELWTESQSVNVTNGVFNVQLGSSENLDPAIFEQETLFVGVKVGVDVEMLPRQRLTTSGYSMRSGESLAQLSCDDKQVARYDAAGDTWGCSSQWETISQGTLPLTISLNGEYDWYRLTISGLAKGSGSHMRLEINGSRSASQTRLSDGGSVSKLIDQLVLAGSGHSVSTTLVIPDSAEQYEFTLHEIYKITGSSILHQTTLFGWSSITSISIVGPGVSGKYFLEGYK